MNNSPALRYRNQQYRDNSVYNVCYEHFPWILNKDRCILGTGQALSSSVQTVKIYKVAEVTISCLPCFTSDFGSSATRSCMQLPMQRGWKQHIEVLIDIHIHWWFY